MKVEIAKCDLCGTVIDGKMQCNGLPAVHIGGDSDYCASCFDDAVRIVKKLTSLASVKSYHILIDVAANHVAKTGKEIDASEKAGFAAH